MERISSFGNKRREGWGGLVELTCSSFTCSPAAGQYVLVMAGFEGFHGRVGGGGAWEGVKRQTGMIGSPLLRSHLFFVPVRFVFFCACLLDRCIQVALRFIYLSIYLFWLGKSGSQAKAPRCKDLPPRGGTEAPRTGSLSGSAACQRSRRWNNLRRETALVTLSPLRLGTCSVVETGHISLTIDAFDRTSVSSVPCFHDDHNRDASWRPYSSHMPIPPPCLPGVSMVTAIQNVGKITRP